jgi:thiamine biosynthesis protein ThiS
LSGLPLRASFFYWPGGDFFVDNGASPGNRIPETTMDIQLNGQTTSVAAGITIGDLIREKDLDPATVVVEHNLTIIKTAELNQITLKQNDALEILRFVGGG